MKRAKDQWNTDSQRRPYETVLDTNSAFRAAHGCSDKHPHTHTYTDALMLAFSHKIQSSARIFSAPQNRKHLSTQRNFVVALEIISQSSRKGVILLLMYGFVCNYYKLNVDSSRENGKEKHFRLVVDQYGFFNEAFFNFNIWSHQSNIFGYNLDYASTNSVYMQEVGEKLIYWCVVMLS